MSEDETNENLQVLKAILVRWEKVRKEKDRLRTWSTYINIIFWLIAAFSLSFFTHHSIWRAFWNALGGPCYLVYWLLFEAGLYEMLQHFKVYHP